LRLAGAVLLIVMTVAWANKRKTDRLAEKDAAQKITAGCITELSTSVSMATHHAVCAAIRGWK